MTDRAKLWDLIEDVKVCMMVTHTPDGTMHARPMHAIPYREDGEIWFYTRLDSGKSAELAQDGEVCLCFARPGSSDFVSVSGVAAVVHDAERIRENWSTFVDAWFPEGPDGDDVAMIRVDAAAGEYWDGESSDVLAALKLALASRRDRIPEMGERKRVTL